MDKPDLVTELLMKLIGPDGRKGLAKKVQGDPERAHQSFEDFLSYVFAGRPSGPPSFERKPDVKRGGYIDPQVSALFMAFEAGYAARYIHDYEGDPLQEELDDFVRSTGGD